MRQFYLLASYNVTVFAVLKSDHVTPATGKTLTVRMSKDGAAFGAITPTVTELEGGLYKVALADSHVDTLGDLCLRITEATIDDVVVIGQVRPTPQPRTNSVVSDAGNTASTFKTDITQADTDWWKDAFLVFLGSAAKTGQVKKITGFNPTTDFITCEAFTGAPAAGDKFVIVNA